MFDPTVPETPESIVFDRSNNAYITMSLTGEVRKITPDGTQSTLAFLPIGAPCDDGRNFPVSALGLAIDYQDNLYTPISACDPANAGLWKIYPDGAIELLANTPDSVVWNGLDVRFNYVYAADTFEGRIWRVPKDGGEPEIWADHPLLKRPPGSDDVLPMGVPLPGPNGIQFYFNKLFVANTSTGQIIAFPIKFNGMPKEPYVHATLPDGQIPDEFAIDILGRIYVTTQPFNTVVFIKRDGTAEVILTVEDGLDGPSSARFGRSGVLRKSLYITNAALPLFSTTFQPSLMRVELDVGGPFF